MSETSETIHHPTEWPGGPIQRRHVVFTFDCIFLFLFDTTFYSLNCIFFGSFRNHLHSLNFLCCFLSEVVRILIFVVVTSHAHFRSRSRI